MEKKYRFGLSKKAYSGFDLAALNEAFPDSIEEIEFEYEYQYCFNPNEVIIIAKEDQDELMEYDYRFIGSEVTFIKYYFKKDDPGFEVGDHCSYAHDFDTCRVVLAPIDIDLTAKRKNGAWKGIVITAPLSDILRIFNTRTNPKFTLANVSQPAFRKYFAFEIGSFDPEPETIWA